MDIHVKNTGSGASYCTAEPEGVPPRRPRQHARHLFWPRPLSSRISYSDPESIPTAREDAHAQNVVHGLCTIHHEDRMLALRYFSIPLVAALMSCAPTPGDEVDANAAPAPAGGGQAAVKDDVSQPDVVKVAVGSKDHTTLVAALQAADLVNALANAGPFTVFAPTNAAFDKLPAGTVDDLLKPDNKTKLAGILHHHVTTSALDVDAFQDGESLSMVDGGRETIVKKDGAMWIGSAKVIASVRASNGWVHIIDAVLLPSAK